MSSLAPSDHVLHFILVGVGLGLGSFIKTFWDKLAEHFWDKEWKEFKKFKASHQGDAKE